MNPIRSSLPSSSWLVATVVPWLTAVTAPPSRPSWPSTFRRPARKPSAGSPGVDGVLVLATSPVPSWTATTSVNVPPVSMPMRTRRALMRADSNDAAAGPEGSPPARPGRPPVLPVRRLTAGPSGHRHRHLHPHRTVVAHGAVEDVAAGIERDREGRRPAGADPVGAGDVAAVLLRHQIVRGTAPVGECDRPRAGRDLAAGQL